MKYLRYPAYKDSGIEWIGQIPEHWKVMRLKHLVKCLDSSRIPLNAQQRSLMEGEIEYWGANGVAGYVDKFLFNEELVLIGEDGAPFTEKFKEVAFYINKPIWPNNHVHVVKTRSGLLPKFLKNSINSCDFSDFIEGTTRDKLTQGNLLQIPVAICDTDEQQEIVPFLEIKITIINNLVSKFQKMIDLLKERRQAIITNAVTKGLDRNVPMKDSGVEWIGDIPEHWKLTKLKNVCHFNYGDSLPAEHRLEGKFPVFGSNGIIGYNNLTNTGSPTIIIGRKGSYGKLVYSSLSGFAIDTTFYVNEKIAKVNLKWLYYALMVLNLDTISLDTGVPGLSREYAYEKIIVLPNNEEQFSISNFLDSKTKKIDALITKNHNMIELMKEYKTSLISQAVTGKIDVRGFAVSKDSHNA